MAELRIGLEKEGELGAVVQSAQSAQLNLRVETKPQVFDPFTWIAITGGSLLVAKFLVDLCDKLNGGVLIDLRPSASRVVHREKEIPFGWAVMIAVDGTVRIQVHDAPKDAAERLLNNIIKTEFSTVKDVASEAVKELGPTKVKVEELKQ
jgi:hypothetical protein